MHLTSRQGCRDGQIRQRFIKTVVATVLETEEVLLLTLAGGLLVPQKYLGLG